MQKVQSSAAAGYIAFMPWLRLPHPIAIGEFRFVPVRTRDLGDVVAPEIAATAAQAFQTHIDQGGKPIEACTLLLRARHPVAWNIPERLWTAAHRAAGILALSCLSEQRFLEGHFAPHMNSTMFRLVSQGIEAGSDRVNLSYPRRGGLLRIGGLRFAATVFQQPPQIADTQCGVINVALAKAMQRTRLIKDPVWQDIEASMDSFLLGHSEDSELGWDTCVMLSVMALERLLEHKGSTTAQVLSSAFAELWAPYAGKTVGKAKRVKADPNWLEDQKSWPIHRKWMKEMYEARSSKTHRDARSGFSKNWDASQHVVNAAFSYPLIIKLRLNAAGFYKLQENDIGACEALDDLLDSDWRSDGRRRPEWSSILSDHRTARSMDRIVRESMAKVAARLT